jgi:hypothetical protein
MEYVQYKCHRRVHKSPSVTLVQSDMIQFHALLYYLFNIRFFGAFVKLRRATISFVMSVPQILMKFAI